MKDILLEIINNDKSYNKSATRYLYKTHPQLWQQILDVTNFLPINALAKQRVWHILNDICEMPTCPQTGKFVKWHENRYLTFISGSAKSTYQNKLGIYKNNTEEARQKKSKTLTKSYKTTNIRQKKINTFIQNYGVDNPVKHPLIKEKVKNTLIEKYGVDNPSKSKSVIEKIYQTQVANGSITSREQRSNKRRYYDAVAFYTAESWKEHFDKINPSRLDRSGGWELDHTYSKHQGFHNNIPAYIIGHWTNLQMLSKSENSAKRDRCYKTQEKLFEDFFNNVV